jgi:hypothetical protein
MQFFEKIKFKMERWLKLPEFTRKCNAEKYQVKETTEFMKLNRPD